MTRAAFSISISIFILIHLCHVSCTGLFSWYFRFRFHVKKFSQRFSFLLDRSQDVNGGKKVAILTENDIREFRAKTYVESIDELKDLDQNLPDVIETYDKLKELEKSGSDILTTVPDDGTTCSVQLKFYTKAIVDRAKEQCDFCIQANVSKESPVVMNVSGMNKI